MAAAATVQRRVSALCSAGIEVGDPLLLPRPARRRARRPSRLPTCARPASPGDEPKRFTQPPERNWLAGFRSTEEAQADIETARQKILALPLVGKWTCESALLWGIGSIEAFPTGDIALLRAVKQRYGLPRRNPQRFGSGCPSVGTSARLRRPAPLDRSARWSAADK